MRHKGCLIAFAAAVALVAVAAVLVGPAIFREGRRAIAPVRQMRTAQADFEAWERAHPWKEPAVPALAETRLATFLALRKEVLRLDEAMLRGPDEKFPDGRRPSIRDVPELLEGVGGLVAQRTAAFQRAGMAPAEYAYIEKLVYRVWLAGLKAKGLDPAARERAAKEIDDAANRERDRAVAAGLRHVAADLRTRLVPAPEGVPEGIHALLSASAGEIETLAGSHLPPPRARHGGIRIQTD
jgi:hypothetical protein